MEPIISRIAVLLPGPTRNANELQSTAWVVVLPVMMVYLERHHINGSALVSRASATESQEI